MEGGSGDADAWSLTEDYQRLLRIEKVSHLILFQLTDPRLWQFVLSVVDISRQVCEELSKSGDHDNDKLLLLCSTFSENIEVRRSQLRASKHLCYQSAQSLVLEAAKTHRSRRQYDADNYQELNQSQVCLEKLRAMQVCIAQMESKLAQKRVVLDNAWKWLETNVAE